MPEKGGYRDLMNEAQSKFHFQAGIILLFVSAVFLLALTKIQDVDAWLHLSCGRLIWEHHGFPAKELYVYTMADKPFAHGAWLFALVYYAAYHAFNVYGVIVLKAATIATAFYVLFKDALRPFKNLAVTLAVLAVIAILSRHRFVERPDTVLMVYVSFSIFALNAFVQDNKKYLYLLPFVHMLWANTHQSIILMFVPFLSFLAGGLAQIYAGSKGLSFSATPTLRHIKTIALIFLLSFLASLANPFFIKEYFFGAQFMGVEFFKQEITELLPPTWHDEKAPYLLAAVVLLSFILNAIMFYRAKAPSRDSLSPSTAPSLIHFLLIIPFLVLSFTAVRFFFLFAIVSGPILARNISAFIDMMRTKYPKNGVITFVSRAASAAILLLFVVNAGLIVIGKRPFVMDDQYLKFGFGFDATKMPEGALRYMDEKNITGRIFNIYHWGQYIAWRDYPRRTPFVDGRGYLPAELLEPLNKARYLPELLARLYDTYGFESVLVNYPAPVEGSPLLSIDEAFNNPAWALVYWDDLSLLYLKRGGPYDSIIKKDEYRFVRPANGIRNLLAKAHSEEDRRGLIAELKRNIGEAGSFKAYAFLGQVYNEAGLYQEAIDAFSRVEAFSVGQNHLPDAYNGIGYAYSQLGKVDEAIGAYNEALELSEDATPLYNLGKAHLRANDKKEAVKCLEKALEMNRNLVSVYPLLISLYNELNMTAKIEKAEAQFRQAVTVQGGEDHFKKGIEAYSSGQASLAAEEFKKSIELNPSNPVPYSNLGYVYFDVGMLQESFQYQKKSIDIDPDYANAYYGLALIYSQWANRDMAKKNFEEYLRLEPAGYYSRRAKEYIAGIDKTAGK